MKKKQFLNLLIISFLILLITGCKKEELPILTTLQVSNITGTSVSCGGNITNDGGATIIARGVCWSSGITPTTADNKTIDGAGVGSFTSKITGLDGNTRYYLRAYATNSTGTGYGMAVSFNTFGQSPIPTITPATNINTTSATVNGSVNANYLSTVVTFEYGTTINYGNSITATQSPLTGHSNTSVSASISGLAEGTSYHYRIKAVNSLGTTNSNDIIFTTLGQIPLVSTQPATNLSTSNATLNGSVNANYLSTSVTFEYGTTSSYGGTLTATQSPITGNANTLISSNLFGLTPNTTYHFRVKTVNALGTSYGNDLTFKTLGQTPIAITLATSNVTTTSVTINGIVNANLLSTTVTFEYGTTSSYGNSVPATLGLVTGDSNTNLSAPITGLAVGTTYHYRIKALNVLGTTYGSDMTFTTLGQLPTATTHSATDIQPYSSTLNGIVNANFLSTTVTFEYGLTSGYGNTIPATSSPITGNTSTNVRAEITGLDGGTIYHYRILASNSLGTTNSNDLTFTTLGQVPIVSTLAATNSTPSGAQLNGTVNANYLESIITFEYGLTSAYGKTAIATQSPVTGTTNINVSASIIGLTFGATYHFRVKAINSLGTTYGSDMTLTAAYAIGENINGGIVFYIDATGQHGLVCAPTDQTNAPWGCYGVLLTGADGTAIGTGIQNTIDIVTGCSTSGIAARICNDLELNGYNDWFLPSKDELGLMYTNLKLNSLGGFSSSYYLTSSEFTDNLVWAIRFSDGLQYNYGKFGTQYVRAVRAF